MQVVLGGSKHTACARIGASAASPFRLGCISRGGQEGGRSGRVLFLAQVMLITYSAISKVMQDTSDLREGCTCRFHAAHLQVSSTETQEGLLSML